MTAPTSLQVNGIVYPRFQPVFIKVPQFCADGTQLMVRCEGMLAEWEKGRKEVRKRCYILNI